MKTILIKNLDSMPAVASKMLQVFYSSNKNLATVICLNGDLGSGKTTFVQHTGKALNIAETINSPTFVISKIYKIPVSYNSEYSKKWKKLIHIDAYRLADENNIGNIGLDEQIKNPENIIFIEWSELIKKHLPEDVINLNFEYLSQDERKLTLK